MARLDAGHIDGATRLRLERDKSNAMSKIARLETELVSLQANARRQQEYRRKRCVAVFSEVVCSFVKNSVVYVLALRNSLNAKIDLAS